MVFAATGTTSTWQETGCQDIKLQGKVTRPDAFLGENDYQRVHVTNRAIKTDTTTK